MSHDKSDMIKLSNRTEQFHNKLYLIQEQKESINAAVGSFLFPKYSKPSFGFVHIGIYALLMIIGELIRKPTQ